MKKDKFWNIKRLQKEDGAALIWVMILFTVVVFAATTIAMIQRADIKEVASVEDRLSSYYAAIGGTELGLGFLYTDVAGHKVIEEYIKYLKTEPTSIDFTKTETGVSGGSVGTGSSDKSLRYTYSYPAGASEPRAKVVVKIYQRSDNDKYVVIQSIGEDINSGIKTVDYTRIRKDNIKTIHRDGKTLLDE